jgi:hypothetical protein
MQSKPARLMIWKMRLKRMTVLTKPILALALLTMSVLPACQPTQQSTAIDRLRSPAAEHAQALAGDDPAEMRETGLSLLEQLAAFAGW